MVKYVLQAVNQKRQLVTKLANLQKGIKSSESICKSNSPVICKRNKLAATRIPLFQMTVEYSSKVATATGAIGFVRLLFRWTGSIYKVVWLSLLLYMMLFFFLSYMYHYILDRGQQRIFERICVFCRRYVSTIPLSFILGFYVDIVMDRWWGQFTKIPWPDGVGFAVITSVKGTNDKSRLIRRTIMRYVNLAFVMTMQLCSPPCKERFPTWDHFVEAGFLLEQEKEIIEHLSEHTDEPKYWLPLAWAVNVAAKARKEDKIYDDVSFCYLVKEVNAFRTKCQTILCYDWICIPIVYTQVVTIACYLYFTCMVLARQFLESSEFVVGQEGAEFNVIVPIFLFVEFFFYFGWLNVAETLVNPFGSDDDDFEVNYLIDRHLKVSYAMVDDITSLMPEMAQDVYWNEKGGVELPYARDQMKLKNRTETFQGSAASEVVKGKGGSFVVRPHHNLEHLHDHKHHHHHYRHTSEHITGSHNDQHHPLPPFTSNSSNDPNKADLLNVREKEVNLPEKQSSYHVSFSNPRLSDGDDIQNQKQENVNTQDITLSEVLLPASRLENNQPEAQKSSVDSYAPASTVRENSHLPSDPQHEIIGQLRKSNHAIPIQQPTTANIAEVDPEMYKPSTAFFLQKFPIVPAASSQKSAPNQPQAVTTNPVAEQTGESVDVEMLEPSATLLLHKFSKLRDKFRRSE
ncbi:unnamed protein product [Allacma fusca]|uniref:Bestrophin homolog n=1 Tax=Allacma fusca TaxID=39272 RepID=A0A8J2PCY4_9HEXA|nr:unnamed protein product [Allacma fusca]